jgi:branched-chain amino acid aminotransferase
MALPYNADELKSAAVELVRANGMKQGYIRPIVYYGLGKLGVNPLRSPVEAAIACWPWGSYHASEALNIKTSPYIRIHRDSTVVDAKIAGHYVNSVLAVLDLVGTHYDEALLLDDAGNIAEGPGENFFMVKNGVIFTPKLGTILSGITRDTIIKIALKLGFEVLEADLCLEDAYQADEAFFTGTAAEVVPIRSIDDRLISDGNMGEITGRIKNAYQDAVRGKDESMLHALTRVEATQSSFIS